MEIKTYIRKITQLFDDGKTESFEIESEWDDITEDFFDSILKFARYDGKIIEIIRED